MRSKAITYAVFILGAFISMLYAQEPAPRTVVPVAQAKRGCTFVVGFAHLSVVYERVLVLAKKEVAPETSPELWVVFPDREQRVDAGRVKSVNVPESQVLYVNARDGKTFVIHRMRLCTCPPLLWGAR